MISDELIFAGMYGVTNLETSQLIGLKWIRERENLNIVCYQGVSPFDQALIQEELEKGT